MKSVAVFGGTGFIGGQLVERLRKSFPDLRILVLSRRIPDPGRRVSDVVYRCCDFSTCVCFNEYLDDVDTVFHLISTTIPATSSIDIPRGINDNVFATARLLDACVSMRVNRFVFLSSGGAVYGDGSQDIHKESDAAEPLSAYGLQKKMIEDLLSFYERSFGLNYVAIRLSNPYGPQQNPSSGLGVISAFVNEALDGRPLHLFGDGSILRDFIYIDDAVTGIVDLALCSGGHRVVNLGSGSALSIEEIAKMVISIVNPRINVVYEKGRATDVRNARLNVDRYKSLFPSRKFIPIKEGIALTRDHLMLQRGIHGCFDE